MACLCALRLHFLWLTMRSTVSAPDKWLISSWSEPPPSDACLLCIVAVVMNRWPTRLGRGGEVINQSHQKAICSAVRILRGRTPLQPGMFWAEYAMNDQKCRGEKWATQPWSWNSQKPSIDFHITIFLEDSVSCTRKQTAPNILASYCVMLAYTGKWCKYHCLIGPHFGVNQCLSQTSLWPEDKSYFTFDINLLRGEYRQNIQFSFSLIFIL